jgi:hypothetical protein
MQRQPLELELPYKVMLAVLAETAQELTVAAEVPALAATG